VSAAELSSQGVPKLENRHQAPSDSSIDNEEVIIDPLLKVTPFPSH